MRELNAEDLFWQLAAELVDSGVGKPFAPAGRVFKEWVLILQPDGRRWKALLREAIEFVAA